MVHFLHFCHIFATSQRYTSLKRCEEVIDLYRHNPTQNDIDADIRGLVSSVYDANKKIQSELEYDIVFITNPTSQFNIFFII